MSDRTDWWNLYRDYAGGPVALFPLEAEFGHPAWVFGLADYAPLVNGSLVATWQSPDGSRLGVLDSTGMRELPLDWSIVGSVATDGVDFVGLFASPVKPPAVVRVDLNSGDGNGVSRRVSSTRSTRRISRFPSPLSSPPKMG